MGVYHYVACHDCHVKSMLPKTTKANAKLYLEEWTKQKHEGHKTEAGDNESLYDWFYPDEVHLYAPMFYDRISSYRDEETREEDIC